MWHVDSHSNFLFDVFECGWLRVTEAEERGVSTVHYWVRLAVMLFFYSFIVKLPCFFLLTHFYIAEYTEFKMKLQFLSLVSWLHRIKLELSGVYRAQELSISASHFRGLGGHQRLFGGWWCGETSCFQHCSSFQGKCDRAERRLWVRDSSSRLGDLPAGRLWEVMLESSSEVAESLKQALLPISDSEAEIQEFRCFVQTKQPARGRMRTQAFAPVFFLLPVLRKGSQPWHHWLFGLGNSLWWDCPVHQDV